MSTSGFSDEQLMAYADGQTDKETATKVALASQNNSDLLKRISDFKRSGIVAKQAMALQLSEPVPAKLEAGILALLAAQKSADQVEPAPEIASKTSAPKTASNDNKRQTWFQMAAAASVALVIGALAGSQLLPNRAVETPTQIAFGQLGNVELAGLLTNAPSGEERPLAQGGRFKAIATFNDADDALCREFEIDGATGQTVVSVACHTSKAWELRFAVASSQTDQGYAPASSLELLENYYSTSGASAVLSVEAEKAALEAVKSTE